MDNEGMPSSTRVGGFLQHFPDVSAILDVEREQAHIRARLAAACRQVDPFPYVFVEDILSPRLYAALDAAWPEIEVFPPEERSNRRDLVPQPPGTAPADKRASTYLQIATPMREVWDYFILEVNRRIIGPWLRELFRPEIDARLRTIGELRAQGRLVKDYYAEPYHPKMNVGRLMMRGQGFRLRPHADALAYLVTALYYFPDAEADNELGTTLYRTDGELSADLISAGGKTVYFEEAGIRVEPAIHAPFRRNSLLAFANTGRSAHGMHIARRGIWRRAYQSHLSLKGDHHHL
jgi:hypothetical protein